MARSLQVQFLTFPGCPNANEARAALHAALARAEVGAEISEIDILAKDTPDMLRGWGSPTILIDGRDVANGKPSSAASCRIYPDGDFPDIAMITRAIQNALDS